MAGLTSAVRALLVAELREGHRSQAAEAGRAPQEAGAVISVGDNRTQCEKWLNSGYVLKMDVKTLPVDQVRDVSETGRVRLLICINFNC